jgi:hypothetical protein
MLYDHANFSTVVLLVPCGGSPVSGGLSGGFCLVGALCFGSGSVFAQTLNIPPFFDVIFDLFSICEFLILETSFLPNMSLQKQDLEQNVSQNC